VKVCTSDLFRLSISLDFDVFAFASVGFKVLCDGLLKLYLFTSISRWSCMLLLFPQGVRCLVEFSNFSLI
jgi:hypothetical protein